MTINKTLGATLIVAGTTIGAGMLGLPLVAAEFGIVKSIVFLCFMWLVMCYSALLQASVLCHTPGAMSVASLSSAHIGRWAQITAGICLLILFYALLTAYLSGASSILSNFKFIGLDSHKIALGITIIMILLFGAQIKVIDLTNRFVFAIKFIALLMVLFTLTQMVEVKHFNYLPEVNHAQFSTAALIFFISFGFHGSIPSLVRYMDRNFADIRKSIIIGSLIPLLLFIIWIILTLLVLYSSEDAAQAEFFKDTSNLRAFHQLLGGSGGSFHHITLNIFMLGAIITSYIGVAIGLLEYVREFKILRSESKNNKLSSVIVIGLPFIFVLTIGDIFIKALSLGAAMLAIIAVILPSLVALKTKPRNALLNINTNEVFIALNLLLGFAVLITEVFALWSGH